MLSSHRSTCLPRSTTPRHYSDQLSPVGARRKSFSFFPRRRNGRPRGRYVVVTNGLFLRRRKFYRCILSSSTRSLPASQREREMRRHVTAYLAHALIPRSESIDTIPSNFSQWLGRGQVIRAAAHTQHAETNHNVSSSVDERHRGRRTAAVIGPLRYSSLPDKVTVIWINCPP